MKILVLGGYGSFGGRLVELLLDLPDLEILVAGRSFNKALRFCKNHSGSAKLVPLAVDRTDMASSLDAQVPDIVVDASGPFQSYVGDPYGVVSHCITRKITYLDLADGAAFMQGIAEFDSAAKSAGTAILTGVSSFPALTAAVLRQLSKEMEIETVVAGLAPSPKAGLGQNVIRAVLGYAGTRIPLTKNGMRTTGTAMVESKRYTIRPPGLVPLRTTRFSLVDVPDLQLFPRHYTGMTDIWVGVGTVPELLHRLLTALAQVRAAISLPSLEPLTPIIHRAVSYARFGEHRSGMFIETTGRRHSQPITLSWHLIAEGNDGPYIPAMAVTAIIRKLLKGEKRDPGARPAITELSLADFNKMFEGRSIQHGTRSSEDDTSSLFRQVLGPAYSELPVQLQSIHGEHKERTWNGEADTIAGSNPIARFIARLFGFPTRSQTTSVSVTFLPNGGNEIWKRQFGNLTLTSEYSLGKGRNEGHVVERFGPVSVTLALSLVREKLYFIPRRWTLFGIPLPASLLPDGGSHEFERDGTFHFDVALCMPLIGSIAAYKGWLKPA